VCNQGFSYYFRYCWAGGTWSHIQKFSQYIIFWLPPPSFSLILPTPFLE
jgi:hypothetical protein